MTEYRDKSGRIIDIAHDSNDTGARPVYKREPGVTYNLLTQEGFDAYAKRFGYAAAKSARFLLAYTGPPSWPRDPAPGPLPARYSVTGRRASEPETQRITLNSFHKQSLAAEQLRRLFEADYTALEARAMRWVKHEYPPINPTPYYHANISAMTCVAVYKAHVSTDNAYDFAAWCDLSYATDKGIVFG